MTSSIWRLLAGRTFAAFASALIPTTLTLAVVRTGSAGDLGIVLASELLPMLLLLPVAGVAADRFPARRVVLAADLVRSAAQGATGVLLLTGPVRIPELAALAAVTGAGVAFGNPSARTLVAAVAPAEGRLRVNSRLGVATGLAQMAGPAAAGTMMLALGAGWSSLLTGALFAASALTLGGLRTAPAPLVRTRAGFTAELRAGWSETRRHPWFLANVLAHGVWHLAAGLLLTLGPLIAVQSLGGAATWVVIAQVGTVGMLVGVWAAGRLPVRRPLYGVAVGASAQALPLTALALRLPVAVTATAFFVAMFGLGVLSPLWETEMQRRIPLETLGRVGSFDTLISFAARPLGLAVAAPLAGVTGTAAPLLVAAALSAAANLSVLLLPDVRREPEREPSLALR
ncbi:MFS transporter [Streptomyces sp. NPDC048550]|uniref:MFS transporter n=1 Tax=unclassified Streptomyces TaxID=2593676 RepID=UPI00224DE863|nr:MULTISPECIES: MFS transporter [unclassified Streptomyces]MCX5145288.1 MFS transporter [Streptomyces sp. NBC_00320]WSN48604.1 MFS transporter [Streptomyces sp. NBC_01296]WSW61984.1 MFS transporter [Streptomyces sp. NBC_00998]